MVVNPLVTKRLRSTTLIPVQIIVSIRDVLLLNPAVTIIIVLFL